MNKAMYANVTEPRAKILCNSLLGPEWMQHWSCASSKAPTADLKGQSEALTLRKGNRSRLSSSCCSKMSKGGIGIIPKYSYPGIYYTSVSYS